MGKKVNCGVCDNANVLRVSLSENDILKELRLTREQRNRENFVMKKNSSYVNFRLISEYIAQSAILGMR